MQTVTIAADFVHNMLEGLILRGIDPLPLLIKTGIPTQILRNKNMRIDAVSFTNLAMLIVKTLRDESCGLLQKPQPIGTLNLMARSCFSYDNINESLLMWARAAELTNSSTKVHYYQEGESSILSIDCTKRPGIISDYIVETTLLFIHRFHCWLAKEFLPIIRVELSYPEPGFGDEYRNLYYGAPVAFGKHRNALVFGRKTVALAIQQNRSSLTNLMSELDINLLTLPKTSSSMATKVRLWLESTIHNQNYPPELDAAVDYFDTTSYTLRRCLQKEGTSFQKIKQETRRDLAIFFIKENKLSVERISFQLGFSDASSFSRAFKSWTKISPKPYRQLFLSDRQV